MLSIFSLITVAISAFAMLEGATAGAVKSNSNTIYKRQPDWFPSSNEAKHNSFEKRQQETQQRVPPYLINIVIKRMSTDLADTIAKYSKVKEAGKKMPTTSELTAVLKAAMKTGGNDPVAHAQATKAAIDGLAEAKVSGSKAAPGPTLSTRQENSTMGMGSEAPKYKESDIRRFANGFLKMVTAFADAKAAGGTLPTAEEIAQLFHKLQQTLDQSDKRKSARATHKAFMELAASKFPAGKKPTFDTTPKDDDTPSKKSDEDASKSADTASKKPEADASKKPEADTASKKPEADASKKPEGDASKSADAASKKPEADASKNPEADASKSADAATKKPDGATKPDSKTTQPATQ